MPDGPLQMILGIGQQQDARKQQERHDQISALGTLLDRPDVMIDAKEMIANQLEELLNVSGKQKGTFPLLTRIFHHQDQQQRARVLPEHLFGNPDERIPDVSAGQDQPHQAGGNFLEEIGTPPSEANQRRGSMTSGQLDDQRKLGLFGQEQRIKADYDAQNDERTRQRQVEVQRMRGEQATQKLADTFHNNKLLLNDKEQLRAHRAVNEMLAANPTWTPDQAASAVADKFQQEELIRKGKYAYYDALTKSIPEKLKMEGEKVAQGWQRLDLQDIHNQFMEDVAKGHGDIAAANLEIQPLLVELRSVRDDIEYLNKFDPSTDKSGAMAAKLKESQGYEQNLLNQIWQIKGKYTPPTPERKPPTRASSSRGSKYIAPKVSTQRLQELMQ